MDLDLGKLLGAIESPSAQRLTLYIPNKDCRGNPVNNHDKWTIEAQELLTDIGRGATSFPPVDGTWLKPDGSRLWETTRIVYTYIDADKLITNLQRLRSFLHRFGKETEQGEVVFEFDDMFWRITQYDTIGSGT